MGDSIVSENLRSSNDDHKSMYVVVTFALVVKAPVLDDADPIAERVNELIAAELGRESCVENIGMYSVSTLGEDSNIGRCTSCGHWVTDDDAPGAFLGLPGGTTVDGKLICRSCLDYGPPTG